MQLNIISATDMIKQLLSASATLIFFLVASFHASSYQNDDSLKIGNYQPEIKRQLIYSSNFERLDTTAWVVEMDALDSSSVYVKNNALILDTKGGVTVWLNQKLEGNFEIEYTRKIIMDQGRNDRLSDMNQFWMATDPTTPNLFTRKGKFDEYDNLSLYYAGIGGNYNSTTRFRKYHQGERTLLKEETTQAKLLKANHEYKIKTVVKNGTTSVWVDGELYFEYKDPEALTEGYFGFRATWSRQEIKNLKVYRL